MPDLTDKLISLCGPGGRLSPPRQMQQAAQQDELASLGRAIERAAPQTGDLDAWWIEFEDALLEMATTRAWPTVHDISRAAAKVRDQRAQSAKAATSIADEPGHLYQMVLDWWRQFGDCGPGSVPKEHHAKRLVDDGEATWGQLRRAGFPIPFWAKDKAMSEPDPKHPQIMRDLEAMAARMRGAPRGDIRLPGDFA